MMIISHLKWNHRTVSIDIVFKQILFPIRLDTFSQSIKLSMVVPNIATAKIAKSVIPERPRNPIKSNVKAVKIVNPIEYIP